MRDTSTEKGKVVVNRSMSLDGFIAGPDDAMDWIFDFIEPTAAWMSEIAAATGAMLVAGGPMRWATGWTPTRSGARHRATKATPSLDPRSSSPIGHRTAGPGCHVPHR